MAPTNDFQFKVKTVKWFGLLSGLIIIVMIVLGFWYLNRIVELSRAYESKLDFAETLKRPNLDPAIVTLGLEHDGLAMRNKRGVAALYMRAYSQFLAIITGAVLALLGAVFVLARVDSVETRSEVGWGNVKWLLTSASPGVVTTIIGSVLIGVVTYMGSNAISVIDAPIYVNRTISPASAEISKAKEEAMSSSEFNEKMREVIGEAGTVMAPEEGTP